MAEANDIQEGFLCPICHKDMRSPNNLITHFQDLHSEEQEFLKSIKDIYGKAKKKIFKLDDQDLQNFKELTRQNYYLETSNPQEPGPSRSHTEYFKTVRRERLDHRTTETNKLIIRLDRLLRTFGPDRKQQEQELVVWLDGTTVTRCPSCTTSFNIARRQHHCRLCGSIMCYSCSYFLPYEVAQSIVAPINTVSDTEHSGNESDSLRICHHCLNMLECRRQVQIEQVRKPTVWHLYSLLQNNKKQIQSSVDLYNKFQEKVAHCRKNLNFLSIKITEIPRKSTQNGTPCTDFLIKMYNSLTSGETTFFLQDVQALRSSIAEKAQMIDTLSKKIASEPVDCETPKAALLQNNIRKATSNYIKDSLLTLPPPPSAEELEKLRERLARMFKDDFLPEPSPNDIQKVTVTTGWSPANVSNEVKSDLEVNPLIEQMNIVRNYIDQARKAQRFEEVASLEANLRMLSATFREQQRAS